MGTGQGFRLRSPCSFPRTPRKRTHGWYKSADRAPHSPSEARFARRARFLLTQFQWFSSACGRKFKLTCLAWSADAWHVLPFSCCLPRSPPRASPVRDSPHTSPSPPGFPSLSRLNWLCPPFSSSLSTPLSTPLLSLETAFRVRPIAMYSVKLPWLSQPPRSLPWGKCWDS